MKKKATILSLIICTATVLILSGCATTEKMTPNLLSRASFDFGCDASELKLTPLTYSSTIPKHVTCYGVEGGGKKATYRLQLDETTFQWIPDSKPE